MILNKKNKILIFGFLFGIFLCYQLAIKKTMIYYNDYKSKYLLISDSGLKQESLKDLNKKELELDTLISMNNLSNRDSFQNDLLKQLSFYAISNDLRIIDFKEPHVINSSGLITTNYFFTLEGSFNGSVKLLNNIENNFNLGIIKHISFLKKKDFKTDTDKLFVEVILQKSNNF